VKECFYEYECVQDTDKPEDGALVLRVGPGDLSEPVFTSFLEQTPTITSSTPPGRSVSTCDLNDNMLKPVSGDDLAVHLVSELAGDDARKKAEEMVEY